LPVAVAAPLRFEHPETLSFYVCGILDYLWFAFSPNSLNWVQKKFGSLSVSNKLKKSGVKLIDCVVVLVRIFHQNFNH
jgi:hypothetical protein